MRHLGFLLVFLCILSPLDASAQVARRPFLFKDARGELAQARAKGEAEVLLVIASMPNRNGQVAATIAEFGGTVQFRDDDVDYIRAKVPIERVEELVAHAAVHSVDLSISERSRTFGMPNGLEDGQPALPMNGQPTLPEDGPKALPAHAADTIPQVWPPVLSDYPITNRYSPIKDLRAETFLEENPTYDGRGVKIAMIDMNPDFLLPELQVAKSLAGEDIPKVAAFGTALDADAEDDGRWLHMTDMVQASGGTFTYKDTTYTPPRAGTFRIALFDEAKAGEGDGLEEDVNRDGNPEGSSRLFAVLWDEATNDVWVDTDQDLSFTDEKALSDFDLRPEFGVFGTDDPATPIRESIGFGVTIEKDKQLVALNLGTASHASLVVGAAVGSRGSEGRFDGVAPGSQLISISEGGAAYGQTESTILSVKEHGADVVYFEQSSLITRNYLLRDGRLVPTVIYERLVEKYGPAILSPTHNYPILGGIDDFVMAKGVIGINGHESKDNFFTNHGVRVEHDDNLLITGGYGPMGNGALKPDVISPSNYVSTNRGFLEGRAMAGLFQLPPGYTIAGGTSTATPTAAGATALLISAAKQAGVTYDAYRIKHAVTRGARWVPHIEAYKQGNGVFSVAGAWEVLKELDAGGQMVNITSTAPVKHPYSHLLATPHEGPGLYERSGWKVGDRDERTMTFTRTSGPREAMTFDLSWAGNDHGTFSAPLEVTLPLNTPVDVPITIAPSKPGAKTALITLDHASVPGYAYRTLVTIVVAEPLSASNHYVVKTETEVPRPGIHSLFYEVPEGVTALKVELSWEDREVSLAVSRPDTRSQSAGRLPAQGSSVTQVIPDPMPGIWEVRLSDIADTRTFDWEQAKKDEPVPPTPATVTVTALATEVEVLSTTGEAESTQVGFIPQEVWITNRMGEFTGGAVNSAVGSARTEVLELAEREQQMFEVEVLPGSTALLARAFAPSDPDADVDIYVFDCTGEECRAAKTDADPVGAESILVSNPSAGAWKIVVDAALVPGGNTTVHYLDAVFNPAYGTVSTTDLPQERGEDARWMAKAHVWLAPAAHQPGRVPYPILIVEGRDGSAGYLVGSGRLIPLAHAGPTGQD